MPSPNPQTTRRFSMRLKHKLEGVNASPTPKKMKCAEDPEDSTLLPTQGASLSPTRSKSKRIASSPPKSQPTPTKADPSSGPDFSNAGPCRCTAKDRRGGVDRGLSTPCHPLPLERRIKAWEAEPIPNKA
ncbi:hypothetical protein BT96DRAFT_1000262 [Gymnopus androsaceus JB14]|uniref:Uncharacterized protein n=1 Tax=Gymnopus androsaceus JB14 TaxID=1447944 RepID=A0A6A4H5Q3_9AGAR|nr:hypothetical protein BT96DRAFT_1000262 [Gymnopus androsaceus JB14]